MTRRTFLQGSALCFAQRLVTRTATTDMTAAEFHASRQFAATRFGRIAYVERGTGAAALFVHGLPLNGFHWRGAMALLSADRRCIAPDLLGLGYTRALSIRISPVTQADMIAAFLDALAIDAADIVANDSGGAVARSSRPASGRVERCCHQLRRPHEQSAESWPTP